MRELCLTTPVAGKEATLRLVQYGPGDIPLVRRAFERIGAANEDLMSLHCRRLVVTELSEVVHCIMTGSLRCLGAKKNPHRVSTSFDAFNLKTLSREQIKSTILDDDCTSFGPRSEEDSVWFYDFYNDGELDGTHALYVLVGSDIEALHSTVLNASKNETFKDQQYHGKRPRLSLKKFCRKSGIEPVYEGRAL